MNSDQLIQYIITPTLQGIGLYSDEARDLILGTCSQESNCGEYLHQVNGPALGIYQAEMPTIQDKWARIPTKYKHSLNDFCQINAPLITNSILHNLMIGNLYFATGICRFHYFLVRESIPERGNDYESYLVALAAYYKKYYNTPLGAAQMPQIIENFKKVIKE